jgi:hypothetical protein
MRKVPTIWLWVFLAVSAIIWTQASYIKDEQRLEIKINNLTSMIQSSLDHSTGDGWIRTPPAPYTETCKLMPGTTGSLIPPVSPDGTPGWIYFEPDGAGYAWKNKAAPACHAVIKFLGRIEDSHRERSKQ